MRRVLNKTLLVLCRLAGRDRYRDAGRATLGSRDLPYFQYKKKRRTQRGTALFDQQLLRQFRS